MTELQQSILENKQIIHAWRPDVHELFHIRFHEPVEPGKTLSSSNARSLVDAGLVVYEEEENAYKTTARGRSVIEEMVNYLAKKEVTCYDFPHVTIKEKK